MNEIYPVTVIIPHFNSVYDLERALRSVALQTWPVSEVIVVDDSSSRDSIPGLRQKILNKEQSGLPVVLIELLENVGPAKCRNLAWDRAKSNYIAFLDADDEWHPKKIEFQLSAMLASPDLDFTSHAFSASEFPEVKQACDPIQLGLFKWLVKNRASTPTVMIKKDVRYRFPPDSRHSEDYELWLTMVANKLRSGYIPIQLARAHKGLYGSSGLSSQVWSMQRGEVRAIIRALGEGWRLRLLIPLALLWSFAKHLRRCILLIGSRLGFSEWQRRLKT